MNTTTALNEFAIRYFKKKGYKIVQNFILEGNSGLQHKFDLLITRSHEKRVVQTLNWKRTVGVNIIINLDKKSEDVGLKKPIVIAEKFSSHAKAYANRKGIILLSKREVSKY